MKIESFIEKALKGGWNPKPMYYSPTNITPLGVAMSGDDGDREFFSLNMMVLNPAVWKAVGKVEGWEDDAEQSNDGADEYRARMHGMIDALIDGQTIQQYIGTL